MGDVIQLEQGYEVPADGFVIEAVAFQVNQAVLTGECEPVLKTVLVDESAVWDPKNQQEVPAFAVCRGSWVSEGSAIIRIEKVGDGTLCGKIGKSNGKDCYVATPLDQKIVKLGTCMSVVGFTVAAMTFSALITRDIMVGKVALFWQQWVFAIILVVSLMAALVRVWLPICYDLRELVGGDRLSPEWLEEGSGAWWKPTGIGLLFFLVATGVTYGFHWIPSQPTDWLPLDFGTAVLGYFLIAATIIVVSVPEGLVLNVTLSCAYCMRKMMKTGMLVREMSVCETIGATTVICSDKTGTLTENQLRVCEIIAPWANSNSCGVVDSLSCQQFSQCRNLISEALSVNTTAHLDKECLNSPRPIGNPTEGALLLWLDAQGIDYLHFREDFRVEERVPFDSKGKFMATVGASLEDGKRRIHIKGAPDTVLARCTAMLTNKGIQKLDAVQVRQLRTTMEGLLDSGFRMLGFAFKDVSDLVGQERVTEPFDLVWLGLIALEDPVSDGVPQAVEAFYRAGIEVVMVTGDCPEIAEAVARQIGLLKGPAAAEEHITG